MTFSLVARDAATGSMGMFVSSSSPAVASRCIHLRTNIGSVASQNVTNPNLGTLILDALESGKSAQDALDVVLAEEQYPEFRQISVVDNRGETAHHSGPNSLGINHKVSDDGAVAAGNLLAGKETIDELMRGYQESTAKTFEQRIMDGAHAAMAAGGEAGPVRSAGLKVVDAVPWATTDLRVDDMDNPIDELQRLTDLWLEQKLAYLTRALNPTDAPSYGVPGDE